MNYRPTTIIKMQRQPAAGLKEQLREDWIAHGRSWTKAGFHSVAVYRIGVWVAGRGPILRRPTKILYKMLHVWVRNVYGIEIPETAIVGRRVVIANQSGIVIHPFAVIGDDCIIRQNVTIAAVRHERAMDEGPTLGRGVHVGAGAAIVGKVTVGDGARIGPNAVVMRNVPAGATVFAAASRIMSPAASREPAQAL